MSETTYAPIEFGKVSIKISHSTQGVSLEIDVQRPREPGESWEQAIDSANLSWKLAYQDAVTIASGLGLTLGKAAKP